ncbi:hypothetical protein CPB85DRAFT_1320925 [Mucidula mucida]|nr:hypothetical protein CPB85DRAFT_1320925 [Mucidula mucida]
MGPRIEPTDCSIHSLHSYSAFPSLSCFSLIITSRGCSLSDSFIQATIHLYPHHLPSSSPLMSRSSGDFAVAVIESIDSLEEIDLPVLLFDSPSAMYNWEEDEAEDFHKPGSATFHFTEDALNHHCVLRSSSSAEAYTTCPGSRSTTIWKYSEFVGETKLLGTSGTVTIRGVTLIISDVLTRCVLWKGRTKGGRSMWQWRIASNYRIFWDVAGPGRLVCCSSNRALVYATLRCAGVQRKLMITEEGRHILEDVLISALILEKWYTMGIL